MTTLMKVAFLPAFALLDIITTHIAFRVGLGEANPVMDGVIQHWWGIALKMAVTIALAVTFYFILERYRLSENVYAKATHMTTNVFLLMGTLFLAGVSVWNVAQIVIKIN